MRLTDPANVARQAIFDPLVPVPMIQTIEHGHVHEGKAFTAWAVDVSMADTNTLILAFKTPPGSKLAHPIVAFGTLVGCHVDLLKGTIWTQGTGTVMPIRNRNHENPIASVLLENKNQPTFTASDEVVKDPTITTPGDIYRQAYLFGASSGAVGFGGGGGRDSEEVMLAADETYAIRLTADGGSNKGFLSLAWYEHLSE